MAHRPNTVSSIARSGFVLANLMVAAVASDPVGRTTWNTGPKFQQQLQTTVGVSWRHNPMRAALARLAQSQRVAMFLDRRVDPDQLISFSVHDVPLETVLEQLARQLGIGVCHVGPVIYFGPTEVAEKLATLATIKNQQSQQFPRESRDRWRPRQAWQWDDLATPRELVGQLAQKTGIEILAADVIPHDLWAAADLPPLTFAERLTLLVAGFDLSFESVDDGRSVRLVPMPRHVAMERTYKVGRRPKQLAREIAQRLPTVRIDAAKGEISVSARLEEHRAIQRLIKGRSVKRQSGTRRRKRLAGDDDGNAYTLTVKDRAVGPLVKGLARRFGWEVKFDPEAAALLEWHVTFSVKDASQDELLHSVLDPVGLSYRLKNNTLEVEPRTK